MNGFSQFYIEFLGDLWDNICHRFKLFWVDIIGAIFYGDWANNGYLTLFSNYNATWNALAEFDATDPTAVPSTSDFVANYAAYSASPEGKNYKGTIYWCYVFVL